MVVSTYCFRCPPGPQPPTTNRHSNDCSEKHGEEFFNECLGTLELDLITHLIRHAMTHRDLEGVGGIVGFLGVYPLVN